MPTNVTNLVHMPGIDVREIPNASPAKEVPIHKMPEALRSLLTKGADKVIGHIPHIAGATALAATAHDAIKNRNEDVNAYEDPDYIKNPSWSVRHPVLGGAITGAAPMAMWAGHYPLPHVINGQPVSPLLRLGIHGAFMGAGALTGGAVGAAMGKALSDPDVAERLLYEDPDIVDRLNRLPTRNAVTGAAVAGGMSGLAQAWSKHRMGVTPNHDLTGAVAAATALQGLHNGKVLRHNLATVHRANTKKERDAQHAAELEAAKEAGFLEAAEKHAARVAGRDDELDDKTRHKVYREMDSHADIWGGYQKALTSKKKEQQLELDRMSKWTKRMTTAGAVTGLAVGTASPYLLIGAAAGKGLIRNRPILKPLADLGAYAGGVVGAGAGAVGGHRLGTWMDQGKKRDELNQQLSDTKYYLASAKQIRKDRKSDALSDSLRQEIDDYLGRPKTADMKTKLLPHQQRVVDRIQQDDQPGLVVVHGLGSGKCVRGDTWILTEGGLRQMSELFAPDEVPETGDAVLPANGLRVASYVDGQLRWVSVRHRYVQRLFADEVTYVVRTSRGNALEVTAAHPFACLRDGQVQWVSTAQLKVDDVVCVADELPAPKPFVVADAMLRLMSWLVTEGWENTKKLGDFIITQNDVPLLERLQDDLESLGYSRGRIGSHEGTTYLRVASVAFARELQRLGYEWGLKARGKYMPAWVLSLSDAQLQNWLQIMFDAEGSVGSVNAELTLASRKLLEQIRYGLLRFGVHTAVSDKRASAKNSHTPVVRSYYRLSISGTDARKLVQALTLRADKQKALQRLCSKTSNPNFDIPAQWAHRALEQLGLTHKAVHASGNQKLSWSRSTAEKVVARLYWLASADGRRHYERVAAHIGGTAGGFARRMLSVPVDGLLSIADRMRVLLDTPLRFELVESVRQGTAGGVVYDLEIDSNEYDEKNYVGGSGGLVLHNTLTSIAAQDALGMKSTVVAPAALQDNYDKERKKHITGHSPAASITSMQNAAAKGVVQPNPMMIVDEAHRARDPSSKTYKALAGSEAEKRMLLTASPFYNHPADLSGLVNLAAGQTVLPADQAAFAQRFMRDKLVSPGLIDKYIRGVKDGVVPEMNPRSAGYLKNTYGKWVDYHPGSTEGFPQVKRTDIDVEMTPHQLKVYDAMMGKAPPWVAAKIKAGLPPSKQEAGELNTFMNAARQVSNTTAGFDSKNAPESPKVQRAFEELQKHLKENQRGKALIYSNYLESGINPYKAMLDKHGIPYGEYTGDIDKATRDQLVRDYNSDKLKALLVSSAGGEGLDLKGTRLIQVLDPHWNNEKLRQVEGRGIRYQSHDHLPENERNVHIQSFHAVRPRSGILETLRLQDPGMAADKYLSKRSKEKDDLISQFKTLLPVAPPPAKK